MGNGFSTANPKKVKDANDDEPEISKQNEQADDNTIEQTKKTMPTLFEWHGGGKRVFLGGTFNQWKKIPMVESMEEKNNVKVKVFSIVVDLPIGEYEYKFYVDGRWKHDPDLQVVEDRKGSKNNYLCASQSDFDVFEALDKDSEGRINEAQAEYGQEIPELPELVEVPWSPHKVQPDVPLPPEVPPFLNPSILNDDTAISYEPNLLPEPRQGQLNHLYGVAIERGVMMIGGTHRFRNKYVSTIFCQNAPTSPEKPGSTKKTESTEKPGSSKGTKSTESTESTEKPGSSKGTKSTESTESTEKPGSSKGTKSTESTEKPGSTKKTESTERTKSTKSRK